MGLGHTVILCNLAQQQWTWYKVSRKIWSYLLNIIGNNRTLVTLRRGLASFASKEINFLNNELTLTQTACYQQSTKSAKHILTVDLWTNPAQKHGVDPLFTVCLLLSRFMTRRSEPALSLTCSVFFTWRHSQDLNEVVMFPWYNLLQMYTLNTK